MYFVLLVCNLLMKWRGKEGGREGGGKEGNYESLKCRHSGQVVHHHDKHSTHTQTLAVSLREGVRMLLPNNGRPAGSAEGCWAGHGASTVFHSQKHDI